MINNESWCNLLLQNQDRDDNNTNLLIPSHSTSMRLHELFATGKLYWVLIAVYIYNADNVVYQTIQLNYYNAI